MLLKRLSGRGVAVMDRIYEKYIAEQAKIRKIAVWGTGKLSILAEQLLEKLGINEYVFLDNDESKCNCLYHGKCVLHGNAVKADKGYYILISTASYYDVARQLETYGLRNLTDFFYMLNTEIYSQTIDILAGNSLKIRKYGNENYSFCVDTDGFAEKDSIIVYSFGIGEDMSFCKALAKEYKQCEIYAFDPTPRAVKYVENFDKSIFEKFYFKPIGLSDSNSVKKFYLPENPDYVSCSEIDYTDKKSEKNTKPSINVQMHTLSYIMETYHHDSIDLLKMDIEGSEFLALPQFLKQTDKNVQQICIEMHDRFFSDGLKRRWELVEFLKDAGYLLADISVTGEELTFIKMTRVQKYIKEQRATKKIGIWGTGKMSAKAERLLQRIGVEDYCYIDNDKKKQGTTFHGKSVKTPGEVPSKIYPLISTVHFLEVAEQLERMGCSDLKDYLNILEIDYYEALIEHLSAPRVPEVTCELLQDIANNLKKITVCEEMIFDEEDFQQYEQRLNFEGEYNKNSNIRYRRKIMEYYIAERLLGFDRWGRDDIYVDVGAASSPFVKYLREEKRVNAYAIDLSDGKYSYLDYYLKEDATQTSFARAAVAGMSTQSAFEMFAGNADSDFIKEAARILKPGGKLIILPLYMHNKHLSTVSPNFYHKGNADKESYECIRTDCRGSVYFARFYSVRSLQERVLSVARKAGLRDKIYILPDMYVEKDGFVYLKFILELVKNK